MQTTTTINTTLQTTHRAMFNTVTSKTDRVNVDVYDTLNCIATGVYHDSKGQRITLELSGSEAYIKEALDQIGHEDAHITIVTTRKASQPSSYQYSQGFALGEAWGKPMI